MKFSNTEGIHMTPDDVARRAQELFQEGYHCSQAVFAAGAEMLGKEVPDAVVAALSPFGGGLGSTGAVCGSLPGALAVIGLTTGKTNPRARDNKAMWRLSHRMVKEFAEMTSPYGGTNCADIARVDWRDREQTAAFHKRVDGRRQECLKVIGATAKALGNILEELRKHP